MYIHSFVEMKWAQSQIQDKVKKKKFKSPAQFWVLFFHSLCIRIWLLSKQWKMRFIWGFTMSEFPDGLLLKILSFLPSKAVVTTSAMSKRWKPLYKEVKTFRYDDTLPNDGTFYIFTLFIRSRSSVESLQLKLNQYFLSVLINPLVDDLVARSLR